MTRPTTTAEDPVAARSRIDTSRIPADGGERYNRLIFEKSPYLLQHAENPIDWYPWGEEAFAAAREKDRPLFVSIGYSTCHWCHVMEKESFEDPEVARVMNRHFVAVKVDREERPDIDSTYMAVCQMMTGSGGWPLNLALTPDRRPFFAATYIPKTPRQGMAGLIQLLEKIAELWLTDRSRLVLTGTEVYRALRESAETTGEPSPLDDSPLRQALAQYSESFDPTHGGFGGAPKFPTPHNLSLLLRIARRMEDEKAGSMALKSLQAMRLGGIYDQIGFGLHRYSVDQRWLVPHFEKMLYDQALTALACLDAYQYSREDFHARTAVEILEYVDRDLGDEKGGFYCGEDADSEGVEGTFYIWSPEEVRAALGEEAGRLFCRSYDISEEGNFEGRSIPHLEEDVATLADRIGVDPRELTSLLEESRKTLFAARQERIRPHRDDKILAGWNGLAVAAFARAGAILGRPALLERGRRAAGFLLENLRGPGGRLLRRYRLGEAAIPAFLEDYAFLAWGLFELHQAGFDAAHLKGALELTAEMEELFGDGRGGLYDVGKDAEEVLVRGRTLQDGAIPAGVSVAALNLLRLGRLTGDEAMVERGRTLLSGLLSTARRYPSAYAQQLIALDYALGPRVEIVLAPKGENLPEALLQEVRRRFLPGALLLVAPPRDRDLATLSPLVAGKEAQGGKDTAYLCRDSTCLAPTTDPEAFGRLLDETCGARGKGE